MAVQFERAKQEDHNELIDLANYVFSHSSSPTDFPTLLPKLYKKEYGFADQHYVAREDGKIRAAVGSYPMSMNVQDQTLKVKGIGMVCVHPYSRSTGYMKNVMKMAMDDMRKDDIDFSCLGGQRQRYQYYGFDVCGQSVKFLLDKKNVEHVYGKDFEAVFTFTPFTENEAEVKQALVWYESGPVSVVREPERFLDILRNWTCQVWRICKNDMFVGYLTASSKGEEINELVLDGHLMEGVDQVLASWMTQKHIKEVRYAVPVYEQKQLMALMPICEFHKLEMPEQFCILRFDRVVQAFLQLKAGYENLPNGFLVLDIADRQKIEIVVKDGQVTAAISEKPANLHLPYMLALSLLFGITGTYIQSAQLAQCELGPAGFDAKGTQIFRQWFPLPLFFSKSDAV